MVLKKSTSRAMSLALCCLLTRDSYGAEPTAAAPQVNEQKVQAVAEGDLGAGQQKLALERSQRAAIAHDPAFDIYVSSASIAHAWQKCEPARLTDVALQLAEGERVLLRSRKGMAAAQMLKLAWNASIQAQDQKSIARLSQYAKSSGRPELAAMAAAEKLAGPPRSAETPILVAVEEVKLSDFLNLQGYLRQIRKASLTGDSRSLAALEADVDSCIPEPFRNKVREKLTAAKATIPEGQATDEDLISALEVLTDVSRSDDENEKADEPVPVTGAF